MTRAPGTLGVALAATFDEDGALTSTAVAGAVVQRDYDDDGRLDVVTLPSGATLTWS